MKEVVKVRILDVVAAATPMGLASAVLLEDPAGRLMPVLVDPVQGSSIKEALEGLGEGLGVHDLAVRLMREAGMLLKKATIYALADDRFKANVTVEVGGEERILESRASDAIALALRVGAPIYVAEDVLEEASIKQEDLRKLGEEGA
ncbi:MAG: bifunctional nuclease family protein [Thermoprotei archaeon]|nr:MAG: bifunctional nuclease family protein [Thermoprotei archaeon]